MWSRNTLAGGLNLKWPILQAPMGWLSTPALAAAVSDAGGLGGLGMWGFSADDAERRIAGFRQQKQRQPERQLSALAGAQIIAAASEAMRKRLQPYYDAKGLIQVPQPKGAASEVSREHLAMLLRAKPPDWSLPFRVPRPEIVEAIKDAGIFTISSATTVAEARTLDEGGVDAIIAQGTEAGGHRGTFSGVDISMQPSLFALLPGRGRRDACRSSRPAASPMGDKWQPHSCWARAPCSWEPRSCAARKPTCCTGPCVTSETGSRTISSPRGWSRCHFPRS